MAGFTNGDPHTSEHALSRRQGTSRIGRDSAHSTNARRIAEAGLPCSRTNVCASVLDAISFNSLSARRTNAESEVLRLRVRCTTLVAVSLGLKQTIEKLRRDHEKAMTGRSVRTAALGLTKCDSVGEIPRAPALDERETVRSLSSEKRVHHAGR